MQSDVDILAIIDKQENIPLTGFANQPKLIYGELGTYTAPSVQYPYRTIELHTLERGAFEKPANTKLGEFLRNALSGAIKIY